MRCLLRVRTYGGSAAVGRQIGFAIHNTMVSQRFILLLIECKSFRKCKTAGRAPNIGMGSSVCTVHTVWEESHIARAPSGKVWANDSHVICLSKFLNGENSFVRAMLLRRRRRRQSVWHYVILDSPICHHFHWNTFLFRCAHVARRPNARSCANTSLFCCAIIIL